MSQIRSKNISFFPVALKLVLQKRFKELRGVAVIICGIFALVSLLTYDPLDASLNTINAVPVQNTAGELGAIFSDLMQQSFGLASYVLPVVLMLWGGMMVCHRRITYPNFRFVSLVISLVSLAVCVASIWGGNSSISASVAGVVGYLGGIKLPYSLGIGGFPLSLVMMVGSGLVFALSFYFSARLHEKHVSSSQKLFTPHFTQNRL